MTSSLDPLSTAPVPTVDDITSIFNEFDGGGSGLLAPRQALAACQAVENIPFTKAELEEYVKEGLDVAGNGQGRIKLAPFASYLAFEAKKKAKKQASASAKTSNNNSNNKAASDNYENPFLSLFNDDNKADDETSNNNNTGQYTQPKMLVKITPVPLALEDYGDHSEVSARMKRAASPTAASSIPTWFGHSVDVIQSNTYTNKENYDPFAMFDVPMATTPKAGSNTFGTFGSDDQESTERNQWKLQIQNQQNHNTFPSGDMIFDEVDENTNTNTNTNSNSDSNYNADGNLNLTNSSSVDINREKNISPRRAVAMKQRSSERVQSTKGLIAPPRAKGDKVPKQRSSERKKGSSAHSGHTTPVADFAFTTSFTSAIAAQAQKAIEDDENTTNTNNKNKNETATRDNDSDNDANQKTNKKLNAKPKHLVSKSANVTSHRTNKDASSSGSGKKKKRPKIDAIVQMKKGAAMLKYGRRGFPHFRRFQLTHDLTKIVWYSRKKALTETHVSVKDMRDILEGQQTDVFRQCTQRTLEKASFSIVYGSKLKTLDVVAKSAEEAQLWIKGLKGLMKANNQGKLHKVIQILVDVQFKDISKANYRECNDEKRRKNEVQFKSRPDLVNTISATLDQSEKIFKNLVELSRNENVQRSIEWDNVSLLIAELEERLQEVNYGLQNKTADLSDLKRDVWVLKVDVTVLEEKIKVLTKIKSIRPI